MKLNKMKKNKRKIIIFIFLKIIEFMILIPIPYLFGKWMFSYSSIMPPDGLFYSIFTIGLSWVIGISVILIIILFLFMIGLFLSIMWRCLISIIESNWKLAGYLENKLIKERVLG